MNNCKQCSKQIKNKHFCGNTCRGVYSRGKSKYNLEMPSKKEYIQIRIKNLIGESKRIYLHRAVYESVNGKIEAGKVVHHKDENKRNNSPENLQAVWLSEHCKHHLHNSILDAEYIEETIEIYSEFGW